VIRYVVRRVLGAAPTLLFISVLVFAAIEIMPGSYVDVYMAQLVQEYPDQKIPEGEIELLRLRYGLNQPFMVRWFKWIVNFARGDMGRSYAYNDAPVRDLILSRLGMTILISVISLLFSWSLALPIGIYSAVRQYSFGDHLFTVLGFVGLSVPNFLLALVFIVIGYYSFGVVPGGLFSPQFVDVAWSWRKFLDLLAHLWVPVVVLGTAGMAGTMRVMRGQLLDQLSQAYVDTARVKGLRERQLILKYPVRLAINPFISSLGMTLPGIVGGELVVSIVLNLPTTGPLLYDAVLRHDAYLAGAMVFLLSSLLVVGNLLSDVALAWVDPRIRFQ
jgi:peptide/nickel transport system permease protein